MSRCTDYARDWPQRFPSAIATSSPCGKGTQQHGEKWLPKPFCSAPPPTLIRLCPLPRLWAGMGKVGLGCAHTVEHVRTDLPETCIGFHQCKNSTVGKAPRSRRWWCSPTPRPPAFWWFRHALQPQATMRHDGSARSSRPTLGSHGSSGSYVNLLLPNTDTDEKDFSI